MERGSKPLRVLIVDNDPKRQEFVEKAVKEELIAQHIYAYYLIRINSEPTKQDWEQIKGRNDLLLISTQFPKAAQIAKRIYIENPFCQIVYYGMKDYMTDSWLAPRPVSYWEENSGEESLKKIIRDSAGDSVGLGFYGIENKSEKIVLSTGDILYFTSDRHHVIVIYRTENNKTGQIKFYAKLDEVESQVNQALFMRIHKSYLVSVRYIASLDKKNRCVLLKNGISLPVSEVYYGDVLNKYQV